MKLNVSRSGNFSKSAKIDIVNDYLDEVMELVEGEIINIQVVETNSGDFKYWIFWKD
ncbi:MAG TPA: hypothetical protein VGB37_13890 [Candidatus Lokiarchaeia archaeon]